MDKSYSVRSVRVTTPWFGTLKFYQPQGFDPITGKYFAIKDGEDMPTHWGYETEDDAWKVIDEQIFQDQCADEEAYLSYGHHRDSDREDFHADG